MELTIHQPKVSPNHNDSFFYDGLIAETENYEVLALGEIRIQGLKTAFLCNGFNAWDEETEWENNFRDWTDADLNNIDGVDYEWEHNNWFELIDKRYGEGVVYDTYDGALEALKYAENNHREWSTWDMEQC